MLNSKLFIVLALTMVDCSDRNLIYIKDNKKCNVDAIKKKYEEQIAQLKKAHQEELKKKDAVIAQLNADKKKLQDELNALRKKYEDSQAEIVKLKKLVEEWKAKYNICNKQKEALKKKCRRPYKKVPKRSHRRHGKIYVGDNA